MITEADLRTLDSRTQIFLGGATNTEYTFAIQNPPSGHGLDGLTLALFPAGVRNSILVEYKAGVFYRKSNPSKEFLDLNHLNAELITK